MKGLIQRVGRPRKGTDTGEPRIAVAAFGKHPGWDDHIPGIGVETDTLAYLKQTLYVSGIGGEIDSGAWEKLEEEKRLDGFDHTFLWLNAAHVVLGQLWSSMDRQARSKYPMVLCADGEKLPPESLLGEPRLELDRLREACKATTSADDVAFECRAAQDQLRAWLARSLTEPAQARPTLELKQRFLQHRQFGPDRLGLLRVLHELDNATGRSNRRTPERSAAADLRPYHIRVPLSSDSQNDWLLLWAAFLRCALPDAVPVLLIARNGMDWLDVIIGKPSGDDLFCLQASLKALPLVTEIPYEVAPELRPRLLELEARFLGTEPPMRAGEQASASATVPPPRPATGSIPDVGKAESQRKRHLARALGAGVLALIVCGSLLAVGARRSALAEREKSYQTALADGRAALGRSNYLMAIESAEKALRFSPNNADAANLKNQAEARRGALVKLEQVFKIAMEAAQSALRQKDYPKATAEANRALALKPNDAGALRLKAEAELQHGLVAKLEQDFKMGIEHAQTALRQKEYAKAITEANRALGLKPNDGDAQKLKAEAELQLGLVAKLEQDFKAALDAARTAFRQKDYLQAVAKANRALGLKQGDADARKLKTDAETQQGLVAKREEDFMTAMQNAQGAWREKDYVRAVAEVNRALGLKPNDAEAKKFKTNAEKQHEALAKLEQDYQGADAAFKEAQYEQALKLCDAHREVDRFDKLSQQVRDEQQRLNTLTVAVNKGQYDVALQTNVPDKPPFWSLQEQARVEKSALQDAKQKLAAGDYAFIDALESQSYETKAPFMAVLEVARKERKELKNLQALQEANQRQSIREIISKLTEEIRNKKPFAELAQWATQETAALQQPKSPSFAGILTKLDNTLEEYEVIFGVKPAEARIVRSDGSPAKLWSLRQPPDGALYAGEVDKLRNRYESMQELDAQRETRLVKLRAAILNWKK